MQEPVERDGYGIPSGPATVDVSGALLRGLSVSALGGDASARCALHATATQTKRRMRMVVVDVSAVSVLGALRLAGAGCEQEVWDAVCRVFGDGAVAAVAGDLDVACGHQDSVRELEVDLAAVPTMGTLVGISQALLERVTPKTSSITSTNPVFSGVATTTVRRWNSEWGPSIRSTPSTPELTSSNRKRPRSSLEFPVTATSSSASSSSLPLSAAKRARPQQQDSSSTSPTKKPSFPELRPVSVARALAHVSLSTASLAWAHHRAQAAGPTPPACLTANMDPDTARRTAESEAAKAIIQTSLQKLQIPAAARRHAGLMTLIDADGAPLLRVRLQDGALLPLVGAVAASAGADPHRAAQPIALAPQAAAASLEPHSVPWSLLRAHTQKIIILRNIKF